jgi:hypothetical protein
MKAQPIDARLAEVESGKRVDCAIKEAEHGPTAVTIFAKTLGMICGERRIGMKIFQAIDDFLCRHGWHRWVHTRVNAFGPERGGCVLCYVEKRCDNCDVTWKGTAWL